MIWDALKAACDEPDPNMAATILDSAGVVVSKADLSECYDAKGALAYSGQLLTLATRSSPAEATFVLWSSYRSGKSNTFSSVRGRRLQVRAAKVCGRAAAEPEARD